MGKENEDERLSYFKVLIEGLARVGMLVVTLLGLILTAQFTIGDFRTVIFKNHNKSSNPTSPGGGIVLSGGDNISEGNFDRRLNFNSTLTNVSKVVPRGRRESRMQSSKVEMEEDDEGDSCGSYKGLAPSSSSFSACCSSPGSPQKRSPPVEEPGRVTKIADLLVDTIISSADSLGLKSQLGLAKKGGILPHQQRHNMSDDVMSNVMHCMNHLVRDELSSRSCAGLTPDLSSFLQWLLHGQSAVGPLTLPGPPCQPSLYEYIFHENPHKKHEGANNKPKSGTILHRPQEGLLKRQPRRASESEDEDAQFEDSIKAYIANLLLFSGDDPEFQRRKSSSHSTTHQKHDILFEY